MDAGGVCGVACGEVGVGLGCGLWIAEGGRFSRRGAESAEGQRGMECDSACGELGVLDRVIATFLTYARRSIYERVHFQLSALRPGA